ncbi:hypothetical protein [Candidatus Avelusimicrobium luingense]|uniref:hypothetical protein n=1 Tax=Candidatus Avelusimicrobium luingense TaxID=3416211 RepID=UPI003D1304E1
MNQLISSLNLRKRIILTIIFSALSIKGFAQNPLIKGLSEARAIFSLEKQVEFLRIQNPEIPVEALRKTMQYLKQDPIATNADLEYFFRHNVGYVPVAEPHVSQQQALALIDNLSSKRVPRRPQTFAQLENGTSASLREATARLTQVPVPGYGIYFQQLRRNDFLAMGNFGLNIQRIMDMYTKIYPTGKTVVISKNFSDMFAQTLRTNDIITHEKGIEKWLELRGLEKQAFFESGLPAALVEPTDELIIPSFTQMDVAQNYWLGVANGQVEKTVYAENGFAQYASAAVNLGWFGTPQLAAPAILQMARRDYGLFDLWKDYFFTRALLNLGAYKELQELALIRLKETDSQRQPKQLAAVWRGIKNVIPKNKARLIIPEDRIALQDEPLPELLREDLILHHPFAYVLLNGSQEVTVLWQEIRHGLDEQFSQAALQVGVGTLLAKQWEKLAARRLQTSAPAPRVELEYDEPETPDLSTEDVAATDSEDIAPINELIEEVDQQPVSTRSRKVRTPASVRQELAEFIENHHGALPPHNSALRQAIFSLTSHASASTDPDIQWIQQMIEDHSVYHKYTTPAKARKDLEEYIQLHDGELPPNNSGLRQKIRRMKKQFPEDPDMAIIDQLLSTNSSHSKGRQSVLRSPAQVRQDLLTYLNKHNGQIPPAGGPLRTLIYKTLRIENPNDPDVIALRTLWQNHVQPRGGKVTRTPANVRQELENYLTEHDNKLPPQNNALRAAAYKISKVGDQNNSDVQEIIRLLQTYGGKHNIITRGKTAADCRAELETYFADNTRLPTNGSPLYTFAYKIMKIGDPNDPDVIAIKEMWQAHKKPNPYRKIKPELLSAPVDPQDLPQVTPHTANAKRTPQQVYDELVVYLQTHNNKLPPGTTSLRHAITYIIDHGDRNIPEVNQIIDLYNKYVTVVSRSPKQVRAELEIYAANQETIPVDGPLYQALYNVIHKGDPNDPDVIAVTEMWGKLRQRTRRTAKQVYEDVVAYVNENGKLPPDKHSLNNAYRHLVRKEYSNDPDIQALVQFWQAHAQKIAPAEERAVIVLKQLQIYLKEHNELPKGGSSLRNAAEHLRRVGNQNDPNIAAITRLLNENKFQPEVQRTPEKVYQNLQTYLEMNNGQLPPARHPLRNNYYHVINHVEGDEHTLSALRTLWESHVKNIKRTPTQVRAELEQYIQEHDGKLPPIRTALRQAAYRFSLTQTTTDKDIEAIKNLLRIYSR